MFMSKGDKKGLVPEYRFPNFEKDGDWQKTEIGKHLTESRVKGSKGDVAKKITVKLWGNGVFEKNEAIKGSANTQYYRRKAGQFIYSKLDFLNQAFGIVPEHLDGYESTVDLPCFDADDELDVRFLLEYVQRKDFYKKYGEIADGGRKAKRIQVETFLSFPIYLPKPKEQQKIADCLTSIDELTTAHSQKLDALKAHKKGLMQQLFPAEGETEPKLRFPEFRGEGEWEEKTLKKVFSIFQGFAFSSKDATKDGVRWLKIADVGIQFMDPSTPSYLPASHKQEYERFVVRQGDYAIALTRPILGKELKIARVDSLYDGALLNQRVGKLVTDENKDFVYYLLQTSQLIGDIEKNIAGNDPPNLSSQQIGDIPVRVPKGAEQQKIADCLSSIDELITAQAQKVEALKAHKKGLMQQLFPVVDGC